MQTKSLLRHALAAFAAAAVLSAAPLAKADELGTQGFANGFQTFGLSIGGTVRAGGFAGTWNSEDITFWCIELTQYFGFGNEYTDYVATPEPDGAIMTLLGQLFAQAFESALDDATHSAAFQLAIWEIVYDRANFNLAGGNLSVVNANGNTAAVALAQTWLDHIGEYTDTYNLILLRSRTHQDFVTFGEPFGDPNDVPEPAPAALLAIAFLAMTVLLRRRARRIHA